MTKLGRRLSLTLAVCLIAVAARGQDALHLDGHFKYRFTGFENPANSLFAATAGDSTVDHGADTRVNLSWNRRGWKARTDYQFIALKGDAIEFTRANPGAFLVAGGGVPADDLRLFDLSHVVTGRDDFVAVSRLDRLWLGHTGDRVTWRFGRQAISWGNGLLYAPMDFFNPFDPAAIDKEYKSGDDMLYGQLLRDSGDDVQGVAVARRNFVTHDVDADASTVAFKYHGFRDSGEYDALAARHFADGVAAFGGNRALGGAVWAGDAVVTRTDDDTIVQFVTNLSYSWTWGGHNVSGIVEYFFNGFGQRDGRYSPDALIANPDLVRRLARGELFTLGRHYFSGSASVEATPLVLVTPNLFVNLEDPSALVQVVTQADLRENLLLVGSLGIPVGPDGSEFGGIATGQSGIYLATGPGVFLQIAGYF